MKNFFRRATILTLGMGLALTFTACHHPSDEDNTQIVVGNVTNTLRGLIFDQDGAALSGATVTINGNSTAVTGNEFGPRTGLADGTYTVVVKKDGYKDVVKDVTLAATIENGQKYGQDAVESFYLIKEETKSFGIKQAGDRDKITLETSRQDDGTGTIVGNTQDAKNESLNSTIDVEAVLPSISAQNYEDLENSVKASDASFDLSAYTLTLTNLTSLDGVVSSSRGTRGIVVLGDELPGNYSFFTGASLVSPVVIDLSVVPDYYVTMTFSMPDDLKGAIKLYRSVGGSAWEEVTASTTGKGIKNVDWSKTGIISINLNKLESQSFAFGLQIDRTVDAPVNTPLTTVAFENTSATSTTVKNMNYQANEGVVLQNDASGSAVDYLRKVVLRHYGLRAVVNPAKTKTYEFNPAYSLPANSTLYVAGLQTEQTCTYSIVGGTSKFTAKEYSSYAYHYAVVPEVVITHEGGGSSQK